VPAADGQTVLVQTTYGLVPIGWVSTINLDTNPLSVLAPAAMLALLVIAVNLIGDAYVRQLGRSGGRSGGRPTGPR
jgi:ABC-type dipeptide/oligopeptide/nickel transport system permease subunit